MAVFSDVGERLAACVAQRSQPCWRCTTLLQQGLVCGLISTRLCGANESGCGHVCSGTVLSVCVKQWAEIGNKLSVLLDWWHKVLNGAWTWSLEGKDVGTCAMCCVPRPGQALSTRVSCVGVAGWVELGGWSVHCFASLQVCCGALAACTPAGGLLWRA